MDDLISTAEAAAILGISQRRVLVLIKTGRLPSRTIGNSRLHLIDRAHLELVRVRKPGRPWHKEAAGKPKGRNNAK